MIARDTSSFPHQISCVRTGAWPMRVFPPLANERARKRGAIAETLNFLKEREVAAHVLPTAEAVQLYNQLAETEPVGGLFHTTC